MANELQELKDLVKQLQAEKEQLIKNQAAESHEQTVDLDDDDYDGTQDNPPPERFVFLPRERKCPTFRGTSGIPVQDWREEMEATLRTRRLRPVDQAYFIYDHLEGAAKDEIRYRPRAEREDPKKILTILQDLYGCSKSYVSLQQCFFSRKQQEGESLQEFSHALHCLMEQVERSAPRELQGGPTLLRDQFVEHVLDPNLRRELKRVVRKHPEYNLLDVRGEAIRWEREGRPEEPRGRSYSVPSFSAMQHSESYSAPSCSAMQYSESKMPASSANTEMAEIKSMLQNQQEQLNKLTELFALQSASRPQATQAVPNAIICRRCQKPGHYANQCRNDRANSYAQPSRTPHPIAATLAAQDAGNFSPLV